MVDAQRSDLLRGSLEVLTPTILPAACNVGATGGPAGLGREEDLRRRA
jgi:hypothetical protein